MKTQNYKVKALVVAMMVASTMSMSAQAVESHVAGGMYHNVFVNDAGDVYASGQNGYNQLGGMTSKTPIYSSTGKFLGYNAVTYQVPQHVGLVNVKSVVANGYRSAALKKDGTVYYWGSLTNITSGLAMANYLTTVPQAVNLTGVSDIAMSGTQLLLVKDGVVYSWDFDTTHSVVKVDGLPDSHVVAVAASSRFGGKGETTSPLVNNDHYRAMTDNGEVYVWGSNDKGQLGLGDFVDRVTPVKVNVVAKNIGVGISSGFIVTENGDVYQSGWLGTSGSQTNVGNPVLTKVNGVFGVDEVYATAMGAFAKTDNGNLFAWGWHNYIGSGGYNFNKDATFISEVGTTDTLGTGYQTVTIFKAGKVHSIGGNMNGELGDDTKIEKHSFPNESFVPSGTIASVNAQLNPEVMSWTDPEVLKIRTCLETATDTSVCEPGYVAPVVMMASAKVEDNSAQYLAEIEALKAALTAASESNAALAEKIAASELTLSTANTNFAACATNLDTANKTIASLEYEINTMTVREVAQRLAHENSISYFNDIIMNLSHSNNGHGNNLSGTDISNKSKGLGGPNKNTYFMDDEIK
jgi:alpha-tubulin suppressor-like RCC1 family protein